MVQIRLRNSMSRKVEPFTPIDPAQVRMYLCGPTVYDRAHIGNARNVIMFDVLFRLLRHVYGEGAVTYVRNFTDVDDKINERAAESGRSIAEITAETSQWYLDDMAALGNLEPTQMPRATDYIAQMVEMIELLIARGHAYAAQGHVLFDVRSYPDYGRLSGRSIDDMIAGARVEVAPYKRDPMDFVLWKPSPDYLPGWDSPWGRGRPGWHIECSAMSYHLLGASFDIHGGGQDLQFPHHENEIAQSCCAHPEGEFARYWLHNEMLMVEGRKMSKSLGNFFTVRDLLDQGYPGEVIRFVFLMTHYSKPMDWTKEKAREAKRKLAKWRSLLSQMTEIEIDPKWVDVDLVSALAEDLNVKPVIDGLGSWAHKLEVALNFERQLQAGDPNYPNASVTSVVAAARLKNTAGILGLLEDEMGEWFETEAFFDLSEYTQQLSNLRAEALAKVKLPGADKKKSFEGLDRMKAALAEAGVEVRMSKDGIELIPGPDFDPAKLEGLE